MLQYALLHLFHAVVVTVQYSLGARQTQVVLGIFIPRQVYHGLQEAYLYGVVGTLRMDGVQLGKFLLEYLLSGLVPVLSFGFLYDFLSLRSSVSISQFLSDVSYLLFQEVFLLFLVQVIAGLHADFVLQVEQFRFLVQSSEGFQQTVVQCVLFQHLHFVFDAERDGAADEVSLDGAMRHLVDGINQVGRDIIVGVDIADGFLQECLVDGWEIGIVFRWPYFRQTCYAGAIVWSCFLDFLQVTSAQALDDDGLVARTVRHVDYLYEFGEDTCIIQVGFLWMVFILVLLAEDAEDGIWLVSQFFCQILAGSSPHDDRDEHSRKGNELSGAEHRIDSCRIFCEQ